MEMGKDINLGMLESIQSACETAKKCQHRINLAVIITGGIIFGLLFI